MNTTKTHFTMAKEELAFYGQEETQLQNLLAVLIGSKADSSITGVLAGLGVKKLSQLSKAELLAYEGVGETAAARIQAAFGMANQLRKKDVQERFVIRSPQDGAECFRYLEGEMQENVVAAFLNTKNQVIGRKEIFKGSLNASVLHPRETFKEALKLSAASMIIGHNHPSGDPNPSFEDIQATQRLSEVGKLVGIEILDHIIIGENGRFTSLKEKGHV